MFRAALLAILATATAVQAQSAKLQLADGSTIRCTAVAESVQIDTKYGLLTVPLKDITRVTFGLHPTPIEAKQLEEARRSLDSSVYKKREIAKKTFASLGRLSLPTLRAASRSPDRETAVNAATLLDAITKADPREASEFDAIQTECFPITGKIKLESLAFKSPTLGEFSVDLGKIESLTLYQRGDVKLTVDAGKINNGLWTPTGILLEQGDHAAVSASGAVELWPQAPGQYIATPKGYNTAGAGGQFLAGALIGRIGGGQPFLIGDQHAFTAKEQGELQLQIVPNAWNAPSAGSYSVTVNVKR